MQEPQRSLLFELGSAPTSNNSTELLTWVAAVQLKARSSPVHPAVDWLYPSMAAIAALEQACLQPSTALTWTLELHHQVSY